ncbi:uncharacterized protein LOC126481179 isoform X1 [Schistocerca serialis cubense]|uniref:uncharacterized protein LOC126481179 isoform X1 n=1 Tax=Schistocerca serialis cubense TaxID=2023355 RepID=UPI00214F3FC2|nr:uncharacterized protein LOC126481179 isoform X1 [Schistocerca serialis cubense]
MQGIAFAVIVAIGLAAVAYFASVQRPLTHGPADSSDYEPRNSWTTQRESTGCAQQRKKKKKNPFCPICLDEIVPGSKVKDLQCDHWLHNECAMRWFKEKRVCPLCMKPA